jgi:hypothetical protein
VDEASQSLANGNARADRTRAGHSRIWRGTMARSAAAFLPCRPSVEKSFARELYFSLSRAALIQIAAPFRGWIVQQTNPVTFLLGVLDLESDCSSAQSANVIIRTELSAVITPFSCTADSFVVGTWLSLVEHSLGVRGVGSSNLPVPTILYFSIKTSRQIGKSCCRPRAPHASTPKASRRSAAETRE